MKQKMAKKIQELFKLISVNSVGKSLPPGMHERKVSEEMIRTIKTFEELKK